MRFRLANTLVGQRGIIQDFQTTCNRENGDRLLFYRKKAACPHFLLWLRTQLGLALEIGIDPLDQPGAGDLDIPARLVIG